jgi:hypothetical protein
MWSQRSFFIFFSFLCVYYGDHPSDWSLKFVQGSSLGGGVCAGKLTVVMVVCPPLLGYGKELLY